MAFETIRQMSETVITGGFTEDIWLTDGKIVKSVGVLRIKPGKVGRLRYWGLFNPFRTKERQHYEYPPYIPSKNQLLPEGS
jgi:hypothetical protein